MSETQESYAPSIPAAVRRQAAQADEMHRQLSLPLDGEPADGDEKITTEVNDDAAPGANAGQPVAPVVEPPAPAAPPQPNWEQQYRTLQGKYNAEVPELRGRLASLESLIAGMRQAPAPAPAPASAPKPAAAEITKADEDEFGPDLINAVRRWSRAELDRDLNEHRQRLAELQGRTQSITQMTAQQSVEAAMNADPVLGNGVWQQTNNDPAFVSWLQQPDPFSGHQRMGMLQDAHASGDAARTAAFFRAYLREHTVVSPPATPVTQTPATAGAGPVSLESLAAPGRTSAAPGNGAQPDKRTWSGDQITAFYRQVQRGAFAGREAERQRIEQDIIAATADGRIR